MSNESLLHSLKAVECPDATYLPVKSPLVLARAKGSLIWDVEGKEYIDLCAGFGALTFGHNPDYLTSVWEDLARNPKPQIVHGLGDVYPSATKVELLSLLRANLPKHLAMGALALSGSQAIELAIKSAFLATGKSGLISFKNAYHGLDLGVLAVTAREDFRDPFLPWVCHDSVEFCDFGLVAEQLFPQLEAAFERQKKKGIGTAALIVEPIQGRAGVVLPAAGWLLRLREFCDRNDVLLIFDEVLTGLGRSGRFSHSDLVACDLLCLGKALGGGLPLSACFGTKKIMEAWPKSKGEAIHTGTFFGHPLACLLGKLTLEEMTKQNLCQRSSLEGKALIAQLKEALNSTGQVKDIRGQGMMIALEFHKAGLGAIAMDELRKDGVIAIPSGADGECLALTPALNISTALLAQAVEKIATVCQKL